jgi:hypothetical protein
LLKFWEHAVGYRREDASLPAQPFACTLEQAQDWCNFVVLRPGWLPSDCRIAQVTVRAETLDHPSSLRITLAGPGRSFRMKQFHLDWWVPTSSDTNLTAPGRVFEAAGILGYRGRDYKGREAACIHRFGSLLELAVLEGQFREDEMQVFLESLEPQTPEAVRELAAMPFSLISYHARKGPGPGPWNYDLLSGCRWSAGQGLWKEGFEQRCRYLPRSLPPSFVFDSVGTRHEPASHHWEYQLLFRHCGNLTDNIWLRAVGEETQKLLWIAPGLDRRMNIRLQEVALRHRTVRLGAVSEPDGERVAQWIEHGVALEVHARASRHMSRDDFVALLDSLAAEEG